MTSNVRTNDPTKLPGIPKAPAGATAEEKRWYDTIAQIMEIRLGLRGDPRDRAITLRELISSGLAIDLKASPFNPNAIGGVNIGFGNPQVPNLDKPPTPTGFTANGAYSQVNLFWDFPLYQNHAHTELWRGSTDIIGDAQLLGIELGRSFVDAVGSGQSNYYWIRHVSQDGVFGFFNSTSGTLGATAVDVVLLLDVLNGAITESALAQALTSKLDGFEEDIADLETTFGSTAAAATSAAAAAASESAAIAAKTAALGAETAAVAAKTAALLAQSNAETAEDDAVIAKTSAETARSGAQTSETASSNSATGAAGSASSAGTSATAAANSATASGNSATAAATSESNANTYATNAGTGASAANTAKLAAETAQSGAETAETNSVSSANSAAGSASNASSSATTAANAASAAGASAGAAATSEANASGYVTDAEAASTASTAAKVAAEAARTGSDASAAASAASAATASASESAAGQSASAANTAKLAAETAEADALTYKNQAVNSASTAAGSASTASQQAGLASGSATAAGNSATAASDSAGTASTKADEASSSADASEVSRLAAVAGQAGAVNSAAAALVSANAASASSGAAGQSASTASAQAGIATTKAGEASTFAANSANSASAADGSATAAASTVNGLTARLDNAGGTGVTVEQQFTANASSLGTLEGQYTVKVDANGAVAGFGLANTTTSSGNNTSEFYVNADRFAIMRGGNDTSAAVTPFTVQATATTINGIAVPAGVYMDAAFIKAATITAAQIGSVNADTITTGELDVANLITANAIDASKLNIDGSSITSVVVNGVPTLQVNELNANVLTSGVLNTSRINLDGATITANASGQVQIKDLGVDTLQIKGQAVTIPTSAYSTGEVNNTTAQTVTWTSTGAPTFVAASWTQDGSGNTGNYGGTVQIKYGSTVLWTQSYTQQANARKQQQAVNISFTPSVGSATVTLVCTNTDGSYKMSNRSLFALETKK